MKKITLLLIISLLVFSCKNKTAETTPDNNPKAKQNDSIQTATTEGIQPEGIQPEIIATIPYPDSIHGIWGNMSYKELLIKYNSVGKAIEHLKFDVDLKINSDLILAMRPQYMEAIEFDTMKYTIVIEKADSIIVRSKNSGKKQLFVRLMTLADNNLWNLYDEKYSAISLMEWDWFSGEYKLTDDKKNTKEIRFGKDGSVSGISNRPLFHLGIDVDGKDYIWIGDNENDESDTYHLIEYNEKSKSFNCYSIHDFEDWEYPFEKKAFAFKLEKKR